MLSKIFLYKYKYQLILTILGLHCFVVFPSFAQSINQEISYFLKSPRLIRTATTYTNRNVMATYFFVIEMSNNVGNSLQSVVINQQKNLENVKFFPEETTAFIGDNKGQKIPLRAELDQDKDKNQLNIVFKESVKSGQTITIAIQAKNPSYGGIYQFGVTTYPEGNNPQPLYLGIGRIHFDTPDRFN